MALSNLLQRQINRIVDYLGREGDRIIKLAARTAETTERTGNQGDAYGWGVFYNGSLKKIGFWTPLPAAHKAHKGYGDVPDGTGRQWVTEFFRGEYESKSKGFELVCVNAAFYTAIQERGGGRLKHKWRVISQVYSDVDALKKKFKGAETRLL